jgi:zinc D-Ala-D-Ala carboxypeptidase
MKIYAHYNEFPIAEWRWPDFSPREIASKREGELGVDVAALDKLQALRDRLGKPLILTSAYRSRTHNKAVGGAKSSFHMQGRAFDVRMENQNPVEFHQAAQAVGFTGFGHYLAQNFMHIDTRDEPVTFKGHVSDWGVTATGTPPGIKHPSEKMRQDPEAVAKALMAGNKPAAPVGWISQLAAFLATLIRRS